MRIHYFCQTFKIESDGDAGKLKAAVCSILHLYDLSGFVATCLVQVIGWGTLIVDRRNVFQKVATASILAS
jgi:hypothetical protein